MTKIQLSLTDQEVQLLGDYGAQFGYNLSKIIRFMLSKAAEKILHDGFIPTYQMSDSTENSGLKALHEHRVGKTVEVKNVD